MKRFVMLMVVAAFLLPQTAFAHETGSFDEPHEALTLLGLMLAGAAAVWVNFGRRRGGTRPLRQAQDGPKPQAILILMALTGTLHLYVGLDGEWALVLNGLGYLAFILALYLPSDRLQPYRGYITLTVIIYTSITINAYFAAHHLDHEFVSGEFMPLFGDWVGMLDKLIELPLIWLLLMQLRELEGDSAETLPTPSKITAP